NRVNNLVEAIALNKGAESREVFETTPRVEQDEGGIKRDASGLQKGDGAFHLLDRRFLGHRVQDRLGRELQGRSDELHPQTGHLQHKLLVLQDMVHTGGEVVRQVRERGVQRAEDVDAVIFGVEKVGIAEGQVRHASGDEVVDVREYHVLGHQ